jgi:hypothetical protein
MFPGPLTWFSKNSSKGCGLVFPNRSIIQRSYPSAPLGNRCAARACLLAASTTRSRGTAFVSSELSKSRETAATASTAAWKAASLAFEGLEKPLTLRTYCKAADRISSSVAGGSKLKSVLIFLHIPIHLCHAPDRVLHDAIAASRFPLHSSRKIARAGCSLPRQERAGQNLPVAWYSKVQTYRRIERSRNTREYSSYYIRQENTFFLF